MGVGLVMKQGKLIASAADASGGKNVEVGFIPAYTKVVNETAAEDTVISLERFRGMPNLTSLETFRQNNDGAGDVVSPLMTTTAGLSDFEEHDVTQVETALTGTNWAKTEGSTLVTGTGTAFLTEVNVGDRINVGEEILEVATVTADTTLTTTTPFRTTDATVTTGVVVIVPGAEVSQSGFKGFTIPAAFMVTSDVLWYYAIGTQFDEEDA